KGSRRLLRHHRHLTRQLPGGELAHAPRAEPDLPALRRQHAREQPQQRRLARAVRADHPEDLAALDRERQPGERERPLPALRRPTRLRKTCGTISPTRPMGPVKATTVPVSNAAATNTRRLSRSASTPSWLAASSPRASRFSSRALFRMSHTPPAARAAKRASEAAGIGARLPSSQWITPLSRLK